MSDQFPRPEWLPEVDLRSQTADSERVETRVEVVLERTFFPWLVFGAISKMPTAHGEQFLSACFRPDIKDDSCKQTMCLFLDLVCLELFNVRDGVVTMKAQIPGLRTPASSFKAPPRSYDLDGLPSCPHCPTRPHRLFNWDLDDDWELWEHLRGASLRITSGPPRA